MWKNNATEKLHYLFNRLQKRRNFSIRQIIIIIIVNFKLVFKKDQLIHVTVYIAGRFHLL